jgi:hypothetical protein
MERPARTSKWTLLDFHHHDSSVLYYISKEPMNHDDENHKIGGILKIIETVKELCQIVK